MVETRLPIGVLISGRGSNMRALIEASREEDCPYQVQVVISDNGDAAGIKIAQEAGILTCIIGPQKLDKEAYGARLSDCLHAQGVRLVCLAGFMRLLAGNFIAEWYDRLVNIHPSLLPNFKGLNAQAQALNAGVPVTGCTVHYVREEMDSGPVIAQMEVEVRGDDTVESLSARILAVEHTIYPAAVARIAREIVATLCIDGRMPRG